MSFSPQSLLLDWVCMARIWLQTDCSGGFHQKLLEASPVLDRANASQLPDRPSDAQAQAIEAESLLYLRREWAGGKLRYSNCSQRQEAEYMTETALQMAWTGGEEML